jgi:hypothetical protein
VTVGEAVWRLLLLEVAAPRELRLEEPPSSMERLAMLPEDEQVGYYDFYFITTSVADPHWFQCKSGNGSRSSIFCQCGSSTDPDPDQDPRF